MRVALKFAYDGISYAGYAQQPTVLTVEEDILTLLIKNSLIDSKKESWLQTASRTDKGVSALGNVLAFNTSNFSIADLEQFDDDSKNIFIYGFSVVPSDFYPRYAKQRVYRYYLEKRSFTVDDLISVLALFTGENNFSNFARIEGFKNPIRTIDNIFLSEIDDFFIIDFYAQNYLWQQIRRIISAIEKVGKGKITIKQVSKALSDSHTKVDFGVADANALLLKDVLYGFDFKYHKDFKKSLHDLEKNIVNRLKV
ncbi:MAG: tRNA pseudouridine(38-40) synthase TruA [Thermoplasmatota archaeon]